MYNIQHKVSNTNKPQIPIVSYIAFVILGLSSVVLLVPMSIAMNYVPAIFHVGLFNAITNNIHVSHYSDEIYTLSNGEKIPRNFFVWACGMIVILPFFVGLLRGEFNLIKFILGYDFMEKIEQYDQALSDQKKSK